MADTEEDTIRHPAPDSADFDQDLDDQTQDFRFLSNLSCVSSDLNQLVYNHSHSVTPGYLVH